MQNYTITTAEVTVAGETRTVEIQYLKHENGTVYKGLVRGNQVVATIGRGRARYPDILGLFPVTEERPAHRGNSTTTDSSGQVWQYHMQTCVRNRQARIVGWLSTAGATNQHDQTRTTKDG